MKTNILLRYHCQAKLKEAKYGVCTAEVKKGDNYCLNCGNELNWSIVDETPPIASSGEIETRGIWPKDPIRNM